MIAFPASLVSGSLVLLLLARLCSCSAVDEVAVCTSNLCIGDPPNGLDAKDATAEACGQVLGKSGQYKHCFYLT